MSYHPIHPKSKLLVSSLELHQVRPVTVLQGEAGGQVALNISRQSRQQGSIQSLLVGNVVSCQSLLLLLTIKELLLVLLALLGLHGLEVAVSELVKVQGWQLHLGGGGNDVGLVHTPGGHTVQLEGTGDQQQAGGQLLQENNTLALEAASQQDEDSAGGDALAQLSGLVHGLVGQWLAHILSWVEAGRLASSCGRLLSLLVNGELATVLLLQGKQTCIVVMGCK